LSRKTNQFGKVRVFRWDPGNGVIDPFILDGIDYIVHLAGANIGEKKWSSKRKEEIIRSRVDSARLLYNVISENNIPLKAFISASAVGYYGSATSDTIHTEGDPPANDFLGTTCRLWEEAAEIFKSTGARVVRIRTGIVLEQNDSVLARMLKLSHLGIFPILGSGHQYMPWIHIEDLCRIYLLAVSGQAMSGAYNAVSPEHTKQTDFVITLARVMNKPFFHPHVPSFILRSALGKMSEVVLYGSRVSSQKLLSSGFEFRFPGLEEALKQAVISPRSAFQQS
jgi:uncharacterized protein (TIGR01777 family)